MCGPRGVKWRRRGGGGVPCTFESPPRRSGTPVPYASQIASSSAFSRRMPAKSTPIAERKRSFGMMPICASRPVPLYSEKASVRSSCLFPAASRRSIIASLHRAGITTAPGSPGSGMSSKSVAKSSERTLTNEPGSTGSGSPVPYATQIASRTGAVIFPLNICRGQGGAAVENCVESCVEVRAAQKLRAPAPSPSGSAPLA